MTDIIRVNSTIFSWNSTSMKIALTPYNGIMSIDYEEKRERKVVYGMKRDGKPLGKTSGKYSVPSVSLKMLRTTWEKLSTDLTVLGLGSIGDAEFPMLFQAYEPVLTTDLPQTVLFENCTIDGIKHSHAEGTDELTTELEIGCLQLTQNGKRLWSVVRGLGI